jgi:hypothetical protein
MLEAAKALFRKFNVGFLTPCGGPGMVTNPSQKKPFLGVAAAVEAGSQKRSVRD